MNISYKLSLCDRHEFEQSFIEFESSTPFGAISSGDFVKAKPNDDGGHPGQAITHLVYAVYHYIYPEGDRLIHKTKLLVERAKDPQGF